MLSYAKNIENKNYSQIFQVANNLLYIGSIYIYSCFMNVSSSESETVKTQLRNTVLAFVLDPVAFDS